MGTEEALSDRNYQATLLVEDELIPGDVHRLKGIRGGLKVATRLNYLGAEVIVGTPVAATIPTGTTVFVIQASTAAVTFTIDAPFDAIACGYLAIGGQIKVGPLDSLASLNCNSVENIHLLYFKEG